jgi:protein O-mannosyl-transferase
MLNQLREGLLQNFDPLLRTKRQWIYGLSLVVMVVIAYQQVWHAGFIWDDDSYVTRNPTLRDPHGLWRIWFDLASTPQYYPLVHTSFWLEYHIWGLNPLGFHLVNVFLHALAAILLWRVLIWLQVPGAWLAAAIFAVHPVEVESVAWITERKNVLSAVFYFASALVYLHFTRARDERRGNTAYYYLASLVLFCFALLGKTVVCSLPAALLVVRWWQKGRLKWQDVVPLGPFFAIGLGMGLVTAWIERYHVLAQGAEWSYTFLERCLIAGQALWFYAAKIFWPAKLAFIYPRWNVHANSAAQWLFPLAVAAVIVALWYGRQRIGRGPLVAILFFAGTLSPALGFFNVYPFRFSFVADHFQYLASVGLIVLAAAGLNRLPRFAGATVVLLLAVLTWRQAGIYRDSAALWHDTVKKSPDSWMAQDSYGLVLVDQGRPAEALQCMATALRLDSNIADTHVCLGYLLMRLGRAQEALPHFQRALEINPTYARLHSDVGLALLGLGRIDEAVARFQEALKIDRLCVPALSSLGKAYQQLGRLHDSLNILREALRIDSLEMSAHLNIANTFIHLGQVDEGVAHLRTALSIQPDDPEAQRTLAWVLATNPDARIRDGPTAVDLAERANRSKQGLDPFAAATLAAAYAETGRFSDAIETAERALQLANQSGTSFARAIERHVELYRSGQPVRQPY